MADRERAKSESFAQMVTWVMQSRAKLEAADPESAREIIRGNLESLRQFRRDHDDILSSDSTGLGATMDALITAFEYALEFGWGPEGPWKEVETPWLYFVIMIELWRQRGTFEERMLRGISSAEKRRERADSVSLDKYFADAYHALSEEDGVR